MTAPAPPDAGAAPSPSPSPSGAGKVVNFVVFQAIWFACVYGAALGRPWIGPVLAATLLPLNLRFARSVGAELRLWALSGAVGLAADTALRSAGLLEFPGSWDGALAPGLSLPPVWIVTLWVAFGSLLNSSLAWLSGRRWLLVALSALGGPMSFWSGARIGATAVPGGWLGYLSLSIEYAVLVPVLMSAAGPPGAAGREDPRNPKDIDPRAVRRGKVPADQGIENDDARR